jgi:hypothetical protein
VLAEAGEEDEALTVREVGVTDDLKEEGEKKE